MGSVWLIWLDFDLKVDSNTLGGGGREEEGSGEPYEPKFSVSEARFVRYSPQATQIPQGSSGNRLRFENGPIKNRKPLILFFSPIVTWLRHARPSRP